MTRDHAVVGVSDHGGWAVLVTATAEGKLLDRRRVELVDANLPKIPHHSEGQKLPLADAVALVERVQTSAARQAKSVLDALAAELPRPIAGIALRHCPPLPPTLAERIQNYRASNVADWVMYRQALAAAAEARDWTVHWYDAKKVFEEASEAFGGSDLEAYFGALRERLGPPWDKDHKLAMAAAVMAASMH